MPEPRPISWESLKLGSFAHLVFERGIQEKYTMEEEFLNLAKILHMEEKWSFIELEEVIPLIKVFFHRNINKIKNAQKILTEQKLQANLDGLEFSGFADRIDILPNKNLEIIDYKTGHTTVLPKYRNWQLGFYALAAKESNLGTPKRLTLEMLRKEKPIEFEIDDKGYATEIHSKRISFNLEEIRKELVDKAREILACYEKGFSPCTLEKNCQFCNEYVWDF